MILARKVLPTPGLPMKTINGGAIIDHEAPLERRFAAVEK
jgi:hypothetical protein